MQAQQQVQRPEGVRGQQGADMAAAEDPSEKAGMESWHSKLGTRGRKLVSARHGDQAGRHPACFPPWGTLGHVSAPAEHRKDTNTQIVSPVAASSK